MQHKFQKLNYRPNAQDIFLSVFYVLPDSFFYLNFIFFSIFKWILHINWMNLMIIILTIELNYVLIKQVTDTDPLYWSYTRPVLYLK